MLVLLKNYLDYHKDNVFECFFKKCKRLLFFLKNCFVSQYIMMENPKSKEGNII